MLAQLRRERRRFDFILIDGDHSPAQVISDAINAHHLLADGGVVVLDDIHLAAVQSAVAHLTAAHGYVDLPIPTPFERSHIVRVRRLNGVPASRIVGLRKPVTRAQIGSGASPHEE